MVETKKEAALIKPIDKASVHRICSGQVILDLAMAVKELVENSLDAGATSIEIKLKDYGAESFEVADNGCGVSPENYQALTLKYHTSKISEFADLQSLSTFGFRGEALSSLCALGDLSVVTRTKNEPIATQLQFDHSGSIVLQKSEARPVGTTVTVSKLFASLPVRHKEFNKNIRREYSRLLAILHAYALMVKNVRLVCTHLTGKTRTVILKTQGTSSIKDNIITVFGTKTAACLEPVDLLVGNDCQIEGFISKPGSGSGRASGDRQFFFINNRPVELPKVGKLLNELYRSFNSQQYPMAVLNFILRTSTYDVNVTPDKRKVFLHAENDLLSAFKESLESVYAPDKYTFAVHKPGSTVLEKESSMCIELPEFETQKCLVEEFSLGTTSLKEAQVDLSDDDDEDLDSLERPRTDTTDADMDQVAVTCQKSTNPSASRAHLDSFQCNASVVSASLSSILTTKERGFKAGSGLEKKRQVSSLEQKVVQSKLTGFVTNAKRQADDMPLLSEEPLLKKWLLSPHGTKDNKDVRGLRRCTSSSGPMDLCSEDIVSEPSSSTCGGKKNTSSCCDKQDGNVANEVNLKAELSTEINAGTNQPSCSQLATSAVASDVSVLRECSDMVTKVVNECSTTPLSEKEPNAAASIIGFDLKKLRLRFEKGLVSYKEYSNIGKPVRKKRPFYAASMGVECSANVESGKEEALAAATRELERTFNKADFKNMKVLGQFNLGFILAKLNNDLFIIDQHASDEKYNFERLSKTTVLNRQPLLRPLPLDFSVVEEVIIMTHIETFRKNGFDFIEDKHGPPGQRLCLTAVPFSKNITFGTNDVQELVSLLAEEPTFDGSGYGQPECVYEKQESSLSCIKAFIRPSRVRAMLASRACRSSIMIGDALSKKEMEKVVSHLSELDSPWNCPHGRPTMRHLADLANIKQGRMG